MKKISKRQREIFAMIGAVALITVILPVCVSLADGWNGLLTVSYDYVQIENETSLYKAPFVDGLSTEGRVGTVNADGDEATVETPTWDITEEWDSLTLTGDYSDPTVFFNINMSAVELLKSDYSQMRMKFNNSKAMTYSIYAVKFDGVDVTKVKADTGTIKNESTTNLWDFSPMKLLNINAELNPDPSDETYYQLALTGYNSTDNLTVGSSFEFQLAWAKSGNPWTFSGYTILTTFAWLSGIGFLFIGFASTPYFNPTQYRPKKGGKRSRAKRSRRRK